MKFIDKCLSGEINFDTIDDYVEAWHNSDSKESIYEYLGLTRREYMLFVTDYFALDVIIQLRRQNQN